MFQVSARKVFCRPNCSTLASTVGHILNQCELAFFSRGISKIKYRLEMVLYVKALLPKSPDAETCVDLYSGSLTEPGWSTGTPDEGYGNYGLHSIAIAIVHGLHIRQYNSKSSYHCNKNTTDNTCASNCRLMYTNHLSVYTLVHQSQQFVAQHLRKKKGYPRHEGRRSVSLAKNWCHLV